MSERYGDTAAQPLNRVWQTFAVNQKPVAGVEHADHNKHCYVS